VTPLIVIAAFSLVAGNGAPSNLRDFLIEDVCVDAKNTPIAGDPAACAAHRDVHLGEQIPYMHVDRGGMWGVTYHFQSVISFPQEVPQLDEPLIVAAKDFGGDQLQTKFGELDPCRPGVCTQPLVDGYDLIETRGEYAAIIATSDPALNGQIFWREGCASGTSAYAGSEDSWLLFPMDLEPGGSGSLVARLAITTDGFCPHRGFTSAFTTWSYLGNAFAYTSGKALRTIVSTHFAGDRADVATSFERFYFTPEYGFTRWEAWRRSDQCGSAGCQAKRDGCNGAQTESYGAANFVRTDCRDSTDVLDQAVDPQIFAPAPRDPTAVRPAGGAMTGMWQFLVAFGLMYLVSTFKRQK